MHTSGPLESNNERAYEHIERLETVKGQEVRQLEQNARKARTRNRKDGGQDDRCRLGTCREDRTVNRYMIPDIHTPKYGMSASTY